jgi:hypothetical protein
LPNHFKRGFVVQIDTPALDKRDFTSSEDLKASSCITNQLEVKKNPIFHKRY